MNYPNYENQYQADLKLGDKTIKIKIGKYSEQTSAAVLAQCGETVVHTTVALGNKVDWGYFPLHVEYVEKLYAGGIIKGSRWVKREGRPSDDAVLKARVIDRSIRPLFPEGIKNQVQIINTIFSYDGENDADMVALVATTVALSVSSIPFKGPIAGLRLAYNEKEQQFIINPTNEEREDNSKLDLVVAGSEKAIVMVEAGANEVKEKVVLEGLQTAQEICSEVCQEIARIKKAVGKEKVNLVEKLPAEEQKVLDQLESEIESTYGDKITEMIKKQAHLEETGLNEQVEKVLAKYEEKIEKMDEKKAKLWSKVVSKGRIKSIFDELMKNKGRAMIIEEEIRPDGRKIDEIRPIWCEVDIFPRTHGSAMFKRGATQAATITTLGSPSLGQHIEDLEGQEVRHYIHHYNMPPYSSGEAGRMGYPKRREIGHGSLAERALMPMVPSQEDFPYTIRVVSEIMSSNGSTSQASICGSTMSLMAAGVPIKKPVAGIAMGLMSDGKKYVVLSDIQGLEDHVGDMDFKVAGTKDGITALQMDIKLTGIPYKVMKEALERARKGRMHIMKKMLSAIKEPRENLSEYAPKIEQITIPGDKIGEVIGSGGKVIKGISEKYEVEVDIVEDPDEDVGLVSISGEDQDKLEQAAKYVESIVKEIEVGEEYDGKVVRIEKYGAFVELAPGKDGLLHISQMSKGFTSDVSSVVSMGDTVHVRVSGIKDDGKIELSMLSKEDSQAQKNRSKKGGRKRNSKSRNKRSNHSRRKKNNYRKKKKKFNSMLSDN